MTTQSVGHVLCKAVSYEIEGESLAPVLCFCIGCQIVSGSSCYTSFLFRPNQFKLTQGNVSIYSSKSAAGRDVQRHFCPHCGTRIRGLCLEIDVTGVNAMTLDDKSLFKPAFNHMQQSAPDWCLLDKTLATLGILARLYLIRALVAVLITKRSKIEAPLFK